MMSFLIMSDTHDFEMTTADSPPLSQACRNLPKIGVLLHCGDLTQVGGISAYKKALHLLGKFDAELKLVIAGNHDLSLDGKYWSTNLDEEAGDEPEEHEQAVEVMTGPLAKAANVTYLNEGVHTFTLKSGVTFTIYVSPYQPEFGDWAFGYPRTEDRFSTIPKNIDILMTHGPPRGILDRVPCRERPGEFEHLGCDSLSRAVERTKPLLRCFGHIHEGYGTEVKQWDQTNTNAMELNNSDKNHVVRVTQAGTENKPKDFPIKTRSSTLMVNAAIMDDRNRPTNVPWLVELELPRH